MDIEPSALDQPSEQEKAVTEVFLYYIYNIIRIQRPCSPHYLQLNDLGLRDGPNARVHPKNTIKPQNIVMCGVLKLDVCAVMP